MNKDSVSLEEFRANLAEYVNRVRYGHDRIVVNKHNKQAAVLISAEEDEWLTDPAKRMSKQEWEKGFEIFEAIKRDNKGKKASDIAKDIQEAIIEVRKQIRRKRR